MDRVETKYLMSPTRFRTLLVSLVGGYAVLAIEGRYPNRYRTLYFDTPDWDFYRAHQTGRADRYKVRSRAYLDSGHSFLEVKHKTNKKKTVKTRIGTETLLTRLTPSAHRFVHQMVPTVSDPLRPVLWNEFSRITLVNKSVPERVTFDLGLRYPAGARFASLDRLVIAEVKQQARVDRHSTVIAQMRALGIRRTPFSKYCVGIVMQYPGMKHNRLKPVLRHVNAILRGQDT